MDSLWAINVKHNAMIFASVFDIHCLPRCHEDCRTEHSSVLFGKWVCDMLHHTCEFNARAFRNVSIPRQFGFKI